MNNSIDEHKCYRASREVIKELNMHKLTDAEKVYAGKMIERHTEAVRDINLHTIAVFNAMKSGQ